MKLGWIGFFLCVVAEAFSQLPGDSLLVPVSTRFAGMTYQPVFSTNGVNKLKLPGILIEIPTLRDHFLVVDLNDGEIWSFIPGVNGYSKTLFAKIKTNPIGDAGITGFAFHPDYAHNHKYYLKYGNPGFTPRMHIIEERMADSTLLKDSGLPGRQILTIPLPQEFGDHQGGLIEFGPDGYLYIATGDGGSNLIESDHYRNGQNLTLLLSKILRIDVDHRDPGLEYSVPLNNPFFTNPNPAVRKETWAYGLRNPFRMSWDAGTGELLVADVGLNKFEEINAIKPGKNYGWKVKENTFCLLDSLGESCNGIDIEPPIATYRNGPVKCFIGGVVYRGSSTSPFFGTYLFGDNTTQQMLAFKRGTPSGPIEALAVPPAPPVGIFHDARWNIYLLGQNGIIYRLAHPELTTVNPVTHVDEMTKNQKTAQFAAEQKRLRFRLLSSGGIGLIDGKGRTLRKGGVMALPTFPP